MLDATNRVVMITGSSRGIGKGVREVLQDAGFIIAAGVRRPEDFADGDRTSYHSYDAARSEDAAAFVDAVMARYGRIQALVNVAGISRPATYNTEDESGLDEMWEINAKAPVRLTRYALPHLRACGDGRVINVVSVAGKSVKSANSLGYGMTKHAMIAATTALRREAWDDGVRATAICPGLVATDMTSRSEVPPEEMSQPRDIGEVVRLAILMPNQAAIPEVIVDRQNRW